MIAFLSILFLSISFPLTPVSAAAKAGTKCTKAGATEVVKAKGQAKATQTTRLGLQIKFVDAESGAIIMGSGLGEASTVKTSTILSDVDEIKFNQSTIGITTKKSLEYAAYHVVQKLIKKGVFKQ